MKDIHYCLICYCYIGNLKLQYFSKHNLYLNFDNDREHRPICLDCKNLIKTLLIKECFINPLDRKDRAWSNKPKILHLKKIKKGIEKWF